MVDEAAGGADGAVDGEVHHRRRGYLDDDLLFTDGIDDVA